MTPSESILRRIINTRLTHAALNGPEVVARSLREILEAADYEERKAGPKFEQSGLLHRIGVLFCRIGGRIYRTD